MYLVGLMERRKPNMLHLLTITKNHESGANHIIDVIIRAFIDFDARKMFPPTF